MSISLTPLEDKIIVKQAEAETQTASGLFIPDNAKEKPQQGEVLAVGPGRRDDKGERIPMDVKVGDKVLYTNSGGTVVHFAGEDNLFVPGGAVRPITGCAGPNNRCWGRSGVSGGAHCHIRGVHPSMPVWHCAESSVMQYSGWQRDC